MKKTILQSFSKKQRTLFWGLLISLFLVLLYSISLIKGSGIFDLIIAGLGWAYIILSFTAISFNLPKVFYIEKKWIANTFSIIAIIGIVAALIIDMVVFTPRSYARNLLVLIPSFIVTLFLIINLFILNCKNKKVKK